ncbi:unnamed protein product [Rangifer tarandus platyrhynchus]|uniref:Uncharacterized protein n=1 Tax=Rangifer tarandus platyrhynchus TaxID=3082113 RepID=A0AC59YSR7_RANTA
MIQPPELVSLPALQDWCYPQTPFTSTTENGVVRAPLEGNTAAFLQRRGQPTPERRLTGLKSPWKDSSALPKFEAFKLHPRPAARSQSEFIFSSRAKQPPPPGPPLHRPPSQWEKEFPSRQRAGGWELPNQRSGRAGVIKKRRKTVGGS